MKLIALLPVRNEAWILPAFLSSVAPVVDEIVAVDDASTDNTRELIEAAGGIVLPAREGGDWETHWGWIREDMLAEGRRRGGTHFLCLDGDEALTAPTQDTLRSRAAALDPGEKISMQWLALWKDPNRYRDDNSVWSNSFKEFLFADLPGYSFEGQWPHRIGRTPGPQDTSLWREMPVEEGAVLHYQFVPWRRFQAKQAWYRCAELIRAPGTALEINEIYMHSVETGAAGTTELPRNWVSGIDVPAGLADLPPVWHLDETFEWFDSYGLDFFEPLEIWHVPELRERFVQETGREPKPAKPNLLRRARRAVSQRICG